MPKGSNGQSAGGRVSSAGGAEVPYRALVEAMREGAATVGREGEILYCNPALGRLLGEPAEAIRGRAFRDQVAPASLAAFDALAAGGGGEAELGLRGGEGGTVPVHLSVREMRLEGATLFCIVASELRAGAAEREGLLGQVQQLVAELRQALEARDEFLSVASHELKTPLTALNLHVDGVLRYASHLAPEALAPALRDKLAAIERQGRRIASLVNDLLDVSRIRAGRMELALEEVDLSDVAREVVERVRGEAALAGCELDVWAPPGVVGRWDRNRLDQVVTNLVSNAIKYGKGKPVAVRVERGAGVARLAVADQGIGIDPAHHELIFQRFERAVSGAEFGGMGLGLWITREILRRLEGTARVESRLGHGARFVVELPLERADRPGPGGEGGDPPPQVEPSRGA
ncbi:MAG TPA: PAS domain-containing sensor histidine kinase [Anaeromyxobacteraceae bacterium]|nr:PAS domain-containing sensor histidine kinase [Anaeromyxobacteraceae bacterium]